MGKIDALGGVDEIAYNLGHKYLTSVYQIEAPACRCGTVKTFRGFFDMLGAEACADIKFIYSDM